MGTTLKFAWRINPRTGAPPLSSTAIRRAPKTENHCAGKIDAGGRGGGRGVDVFAQFANDKAARKGNTHGDVGSLVWLEHNRSLDRPNDIVRKHLMTIGFFYQTQQSNTSTRFRQLYLETPRRGRREGSAQ